MTAPAYIADLVAQTLDTGDTNVWVEPTGMTAGTIVSPETDFFIEGTGCAAKYMASGGTGLGALVRDNGAGVTIPSPGGFFIWIYPQGVNQLNNFANGGVRLIVGSAVTAYYVWRVAGDDTIPYGGWTCWCIDPSAPTTVVDDGTGLDADYVVGSPSATKQVFGAGVNQQVNAKGGVGFDVMRYGRGEMKIEFGDAGGYATFAGAAAYNDGTSVRAGLFQAIKGGYLYKGLFLMGSATNAVDFRDSNAVIVIENTFRMTSDFNTIEIRNASSRVDWTTVSVTALGTVARGNFLVTHNADINFTGCSFTGMGTFSLLSATAMLACVFRGCGQITAAGANLSGSAISGYEGTADTAAVIWNVNTDPNGLLDDMVFTMGTAATHAIEFGTTAPITVTLTGQTYVGYGADGSTSAALLLDDRGSNVTWTINYPGGDVPTYKKVRVTDTVNLVNTVNVTLTGLVNPTEVRAYSRDGSGDSDVELSGEEDVTDGSSAISLSAGTHINIVVYSLGYLPVYFTDFVIPSSAASLPVSQVVDRQYANP